jgi:hypothetical protein
MAIDRIPGVGPQNTDIATAVAAAVPTIAAITSSITTNAASAGLTNASITSAGNAAGWGATGPTTTQIAAAVPTLAQITSAVTTNAASAGVTNASIATQVANNASPYGGTWATLASISTPGTPSVSVTGLGGYKYLQIMFSYWGFNTSDSLRMRFNNDTSSVYYNFTAGSGGSEGAISDTQFRLAPTTNFLRFNAMFEIRGSNVSVIKMYSGFAWGAAGNLNAGFGIGTYDSSTAISSIQLFSGSGSNMDSGGRFLVRGAN